MEIRVDAGDAPAGQPPVRELHAQAGFRLLHYFSLASLAAFLAVAAVLFYLERRQGEFFRQTQLQQSIYFRQVQDGFARQYALAARRDLLMIHEAGNVNLTRVLENTLWEKEFAPLLARAERIPVDHCRAIADVKDPKGKLVRPEGKKACFAAVGRQIMGFPGFPAIDVRVRDSMKRSNVFKIKVFDLRGITVYSSEHSQIGEDSRRNHGWITAATGTPASELTHRDTFSAFEGVVENRDLISSYLPVLAPGRDTVVGVFEIYSDVTAFLTQIANTSEQIEKLNAANQASVERAARANQETVDASSTLLLGSIMGLLALLYVALLLLVRNGQAIIDKRERERETALNRERRWHTEKMAALSTMAASLSHEIGNPLATISALAEDIAEREAKGDCQGCGAGVILEQTVRIAEMTRHIANFAALRGASPEPVDVNQIVKSVCDFMRFDRRFRRTKMQFRPAPGLPTRYLVPDHLTEVLMNLLQACAEGHSEPRRGPEEVRLGTELRGEDIVIRIDCLLPDGSRMFSAKDDLEGPRIELTRRLVENMQGQFLIDPAQGGLLEIVLPPSRADASTV